MPETILIVEDELSLRETLTYKLQREGYTVQAVADGRSAVDAARRIKPDLILLDLMLPQLDGFEVCRILRREMNTPIIMLTARDEERDRVTGLDVGADDYLTKPFSMRELLARVKAQFRRSRLVREEMKNSADIISNHEKLVFGNLVINITRREVTLDGEVLQLKPQEYNLLLFLAEHKGQLLKREFILERLWGWDYIGDSRTVDVHIRWLRQEIEADPQVPKRIVTVRGGGYRFEG
jgi:DNA-binding response OmpR family regulator